MDCFYIEKFRIFAGRSYIISHTSMLINDTLMNTKLNFGLSIRVLSLDEQPQAKPSLLT